MKKLMLVILTGFLFFSCINVHHDEPRAVAIERPEPPPPARGVFYYSQFGASGCGTVCDFDAIVMTHERANLFGYTVRADPGAIYYIGATTRTAFIRTNTDWRGATFILDDAQVQFGGSDWADSSLFIVESKQRPFQIHSINRLTRGQERVPLNLGQRVMLNVRDETTRVFIRSGANESAGTTKRDIILVEKDGTVYPGAPIQWDFDHITDITAFPVDEDTLYITGGHFIRIVNPGVTPDMMMRRNIRITRSNVVVCGIFHEIPVQNLPITSYTAFIQAYFAANVTIQNSTFTGRLPPPFGGTLRGTYDLGANSTINFTLRNVDQTNDITNSRYWGIFISNFAKNILLDNVRLSRFDAHMGVYNVTIRDSELGWQGVQTVGKGDLVVINTTVRGSARYIALRPDFGSTWEGNIYIRNGRFYPLPGQISIITTTNNGQWWYGYDTFMPEFVFIDGFHIQDPGLVGEVRIIQNTQRVVGRPEPFPFRLTDTVFMRNVTTASGRPLMLAPNLVNDVTVINNPADQSVWDWGW